MALLIVLTAVSWAVLLWQQSAMNMAAPLDEPSASMSAMSGMEEGASSGAGEVAMGGLTMGMSALIFMTMWVVMMVAMMFPTAAPMILTFSRVHATKRERGRSFVPTWVFVAGYLVIWTIFGFIAYGLALGVEALERQVTWLAENTSIIAGIVLIIAGIYQLTPLKYACLTKCRTPFQFIFKSWRDGYSGSFRMGLEHGLYCVGCCWLLFVILFPLGVMNVAAMALITLLIFAEKSLPVGRRVSQVASLALIAYGLLIFFLPGALPGV